MKIFDLSGSNNILVDLIETTARELSVSEFVELFYSGSVTDLAECFGVSRQTVHNWMNDDSYSIEVIFNKIETKTVFDFELKKSVKRVGVPHKGILTNIGFIYAVSGNGITKIGCSKNPKERSKTVAREVGFEEYETYISKPVYMYKDIEKKIHSDLSEIKRDNTIYQREVFSCDLRKAKAAILNRVSTIPTGLKGDELSGWDYVIGKLDERFK